MWRWALAFAAAAFALVAVTVLAPCQPEEPAAPAAAIVPPPAPADPTVWTRFRGPEGSGHAPFDEPPAGWDATTGAGIAWQTALPLPGANSPVIWHDRLFVTGADESRRAVYCLDAHSGALLWATPVGPDYQAEPRLHAMTGHAPATGTTDGERVYEVFPTGHVVALDFGGALVWERRFDMSEDIYGHATSLVLHGDRLYVQIDLGKPDIGRSQMLALDPATGETIWEIPRPVQGSWTTPIVITAMGPEGWREELITSAKPWVIAYDPLTGDEYWRVRCIEGDSAPSPIHANGHIFVANIYAELTAIRPGGSGDVTETHVSWSEPGRLPDITSPLSNGKLVWTLATNGLLSCYDAADGALIWTEALGARFRTSPSLIGDSVLLISESGEAITFAAEREYRQVGAGSFGEPVYSCPAFAHGLMYVRGEGHVFCVKEW